MKIFIKNSYLFLIFFILLLSKNFWYDLFSPKREINLSDIAITKLTNELNALNSDFLAKTSGVYGRVLYQNPYKYQEELVLAANGEKVNKNDYVISEIGLIGVVDKVYQNQIIVRMLTSKDLLLQVKINNCYGLYSYNKRAFIKNVSNLCPINFGDQVYTSNLGYQDDQILIGTVKTIHFSSGIPEKFELELANDFNRLNYLVILTGD